jgi:cytochrome c biogenesis protein CcdA/glutaredoxin-related protein
MKPAFLTFCLLALLCSLLACPVGGVSAPVSPDVPMDSIPKPGEIYFFFDHDCGECQRVIAYLEEVRTSYPAVPIHPYDVNNNPENYAQFHRYSLISGITNPAVPAIFFAGRMIEGEDRIRSDLVALLSEDEGEPTVVQTGSTISAVTTPVNETEAGGNTITPVPGELYIFYNVHCGECQRVLSYLQDFQSRYPGIPIHYYDIFDNSTNEALFQKFNTMYDVPYSPVPAAFYNGSALIGEEGIKEGLEPLIQGKVTAPVRTPTETSAIPSGEQTPVPEENSGLTVPLVISAALVDGINPCAFAVLIFLLLSIISLDSKKRMILVGSSYIAAVFVFYLLSGLGLFAVVQVAGVARLFSLGAALIALAAGILMLRDALSSSDTPLMAIPESRRGVIDRYIRLSSVPAALVLGILVGMFELPCTGGIYLAILSLLSEQMTLSEGLPLLLLYNVIFILPLVIILALVVWGIPPERLTRWRKEKRKMVRLLMAAVMIGIGIVVLYLALNR